MQNYYDKDNKEEERKERLIMSSNFNINKTLPPSKDSGFQTKQEK